MIFTILLLQTATASRWYYPDESDHREVVDERFELTGAVLVGVSAPGVLPAHPEVASVTWLTRQPAVGLLVLRDGADDLLVSQQLHDEPAVEWAHPDFRLPLTLHSLPDDPYVTDQWHLENEGQSGSPGVDVNASGAWELTTGAGQLIAIIDSGVDVAHPDLFARSGTDYLDEDDDSYPADGNAHGTACAGLAAGSGDNGQGIAGVAYDAEVIGIRLIGGSTAISATYSALAEATDAGASVISNSWGYQTSCEGFTIPAAFRAALDYPEENGRGGLGTVIVQAAGNDNCDISGDGLIAYPTTFAVAALSASDVKESYSSYGDPIDISAPSGGLVTTDITGSAGYGSYDGDDDYTGGMSGTSASTPIVAGVFALMFSVNDRLTAADARAVICQTATRNDILDATFDASGWSPLYGCGRVDAAAAVAAVANAAPAAPAPTATAEAYADRIWLDWSAAEDADGDRLTYRVEWQVGEGDVTEEVVDGLALELTGAAEGGDELTWQVQAVDLWGGGDWSEPVTTAILDRPAAAMAPMPEGGCASAAGRSSVWWLWLVLLGLVGRLQRGSSSESAPSSEGCLKV